MTDLALRCRCGVVRGTIRGLAPDQGSRVVCYCDDCRAFARFLERPDLLDAHGGSDIFQIAPNQVALTAGVEQLGCVRLKPDGMFRWYARCCHTPLGNTVSGRLPFVGLSPTILAEALAAQGLTADGVLGPAVGVQGRFAQPAGAPGASTRAPLGLVVRVVKNLTVWWLRGAAQPSPYFETDGRPKTVPRVLAPQERARLAD